MLQLTFIFANSNQKLAALRLDTESTRHFLPNIRPLSRVLNVLVDAIIMFEGRVSTIIKAKEGKLGKAIALVRRIFPIEEALGIFHALYPSLLFIPVFTMYIGAVLASGKLLPLTGSLPLALVTMGCLYSLLSLLDDYFDYPIDRKYACYRPLPSKRLTFFVYRFLYALFAFIAAICSFTIGRPFLIWFVIYLAASILYSYNPPRITDKGLSGNITLALLTVTFPALMGAHVMGGLLGIKKVIFFAIAASLMELAIDVGKDFIESQASRETGREKVPDQLGKRGTFALSLALIAGSIGLGILGLPQKTVLSMFFIGLSVGLAVLFVHSAKAKGANMFKSPLLHPIVKIFKEETRMYRIFLSVTMGLYLTGFLVCLL